MKEELTEMTSCDGSDEVPNWLTVPAEIPKSQNGIAPIHVQGWTQWSWRSFPTQIFHPCLCPHRAQPGQCFGRFYPCRNMKIHLFHTLWRGFAPCWKSRGRIRWEKETNHPHKLILVVPRAAPVSAEFLLLWLIHLHTPLISSALPPLCPKLHLKHK